MRWRTVRRPCSVSSTDRIPLRSCGHRCGVVGYCQTLFSEVPMLFRNAGRKWIFGNAVRSPPFPTQNRFWQYCQTRFPSTNLPAVLPKSPVDWRHWGQGISPASGVLTSKCDACDTKGPALRDLWRSLRHGRGFLLMESRPSLYSTYVLKKWVWPQFSNKHFYRL